MKAFAKETTTRAIGKKVIKVEDWALSRCVK